MFFIQIYLEYMYPDFIQIRIERCYFWQKSSYNLNKIDFSTLSQIYTALILILSKQILIK